MVESKGNPNTEIRSWRFLKLFFVCTKNVYYIKNTQKASFFCQEFRVISFSRTIGEMFHRFQIFAALIIFVSRFCSTLFLEKMVGGTRQNTWSILGQFAPLFIEEGGNLAQPDFFLLFCRYNQNGRWEKLGDNCEYWPNLLMFPRRKNGRRKKEKMHFRT